MKKTQFKDATRNVKKRIVSYLSICLVIMLGVGAFLATRYMEAGIINESAGYYDDRGFKDFELISSLGVSENNIEKIKQVDGVVDAEGVMQYDGSISKGDVKTGVTVISRTERISIPLLVDGTMPTAITECAIGEDFAETSGIGIGDTVSVYLSGSSGDDPLRAHEFTVSGLIKHPDYVHRKLTNTVVLPLNAFDMSVTENGYTRVFVKADDVAYEDVFTQKYFDQMADTKQALKDISGTLASDRASEVKDKALAEIDKEWAEALAELEDAEHQIDSDEARLNAELAKARKTLNSSQATLNEKIAAYNRLVKNGESALKKAKESKALIDKNLPAVEKYVKQMTEQYEGDLEAALSELAAVEKMLAKLDGLDVDSDEYKEEVKAIAEYILEKQDLLLSIRDFCKNKDVQEAAKKINEITGGEIDAVAVVNNIANFDYDTLFKLAEEAKEGNSLKEFVEQLKQNVKEIEDLLNRYRQYQALIDQYKANKANIEKQIADKEKELAAYKKKIAAEKKKYQAKINKGLSQYYAQKAKYEQQLEEAKALLEENREEAEAKLAEVKATVEDIDCEYIVLDRNANAGYIDVKVQLDSLRSTGLVFGVLFILITAIVCLSTLTIIIDEQRKLIGTVKAFGFNKREVLSKYLFFGISAGIAGDILATLTGLGLSEIVQTVYSASNLYQYGRAATVMRPIPTLIISLAMILVCAAASVFACLDILRSPASMLMKGDKAVKKTKHKNKTSSGRGSLYSRLILRNIRDDKARVIVSTAIVAFCCMLIGVGISFKLATTGMLAKQQGDINNFDLRVDAGDSVTDSELQQMESLIAEKSDDYTSAVYESHLFSTGDSITGMTVLAGDPSEIGKYYGMNSGVAGSELTSDGLVIPIRMSENYGYDAGSSIPVFDSSMEIKDAPVSGTYTCYFGRVAVTTPEGYSRIFGGDYAPRSFFIHLDSDTSELKNALLDINEDISFEESSDFRESFESVGMLYNIIVFVTTGVAIFMSFMILTNLASIFVNRKKNELIVMRINGFSIKQTKRYLTKEAVLTTAIGLAVGVIVGSVLSPFAVRILEPADLQFDRSYQALAWVLAAGLEGLFALIIYSGIFRRIKRYDLKDIA